MTAAKHIHYARVYTHHTDCFRMVYHATYLDFFSEARSEWFREHGTTVCELHKNGYTFPIKAVQMEYFLPARLDDKVRIETRPVKIGKVSLTVEQILYIEEQTTPAVHAIIRVACIGDNLRPRPLPDELVNLVGEIHTC